MSKSAIAKLALALILSGAGASLAYADGQARPLRRQASPPVRAHDPGNGPRWTSNGWSYAPVLGRYPGSPAPVYYAPPAYDAGYYQPSDGRAFHHGAPHGWAERRW